MIKVSVIVPIYGVEQFIERCARSLFEQTLDNIEYLFVNDCTKDRSMEILHNVLKEYPHRALQTKIIDMPQNSGQAAVRKCGMEQATGEYVIHCDSDDWVEKDMYQIMYEKAKSEDLDIVWCDYYRSDAINHKYMSMENNKKLRLMQGPVWNKLVKRSLYIENEIIYPTANKAEDGALMTQLSFWGKKRGYIAKPLYYYYINPDSICGQVSEEACLRKLSQEMENVELKINFLKREGVVNEYKDEILNWKYVARTNLYPIMHQRKYRKLWRNTYPEVNREYLLYNKLSFKTRIKMLLIYLGVYRINNL